MITIIVNNKRKEEKWSIHRIWKEGKESKNHDGSSGNLELCISI